MSSGLKRLIEQQQQGQAGPQAFQPSNINTQAVLPPDALRIPAFSEGAPPLNPLAASGSPGLAQSFQDDFQKSLPAGTGPSGRPRDAAPPERIPRGNGFAQGGLGDILRGKKGFKPGIARLFR